MQEPGAGKNFEVEEAMHVVRGNILQEGQIFTLSNFDEFYMVSALLDATNTIALSISPSEFCIFGYFSIWRWNHDCCKNRERNHDP